VADNSALAVLFFFVVALLLGGFGFYMLGGGPLLTEWWEGFKEWRERTRAEQASRRARLEEEQASRRARLEEERALEQREREFGVEVGLLPSAVLDRAVEGMTRSGYGLETRTENATTFARHQGPNIAFGILFTIFCCVIPGIIYLLLAERTVRVTITAYPIEGGSRVVVGGDNQQDIWQAINWARRLPKPGEGVPPEPADQQASEPGEEAPPEPAEQQAVEPPETTSPSVAPDVPEQIRRLAELRDTGLITQEEFETKKAELLRRM
jgi:Short C-terminal domain